MVFWPKVNLTQLQSADKSKDLGNELRKEKVAVPTSLS